MEQWQHVVQECDPQGVDTCWHNAAATSALNKEIVLAVSTKTLKLRNGWTKSKCRLPLFISNLPACWINNAVASCSNRLAKPCHQQACYKLFHQLDAGLIISTCNKSVLTTCNSILDSTSLSQVVLTDLSTGLLQVVSTSCNKSANDRLQQAWF
jgi:hypothetical protein